jgi:CubicO group peptidase (beta-lactamase class C family)
MIVGEASGEGYREYLRAHLFEPLGLSGSYYCDERPIIPNRAEGYTYTGQALVNDEPISMNQPGAAGALCSTVPDLLRWTLALRTVLVENSPMLTVRGLGRILGSLAGLGFDAAWGVYAAADEGAPHLRRRLWIVGNANGDGESARAGDGGQVAGVPGMVTADANRAGLEKREGVAGNDGEEFPAALGGGWWESEPEVGRVAHGVADRVEQLRAIGNGQVPAVVVRAWRELSAAVMATDEEATT